MAYRAYVNVNDDTYTRTEIIGIYRQYVQRRCWCVTRRLAGERHKTKKDNVPFALAAKVRCGEHRFEPGLQGRTEPIGENA